MKALDKETAIARMNTFERKDIPFLFIIDYTQEYSYVEALGKIDTFACLYQFRGTSNAPIADIRYAGPTNWKFTPPSPAAYYHSFDIVKQNLLAGNSYLTSLTYKVPLRTNLALKEIFLYPHALYKLWLRDSSVYFSPEIFVCIEEGKIKSFPMKGTIDATLPHAEAILLDDAKEAAEHTTVVDLVRNDLSMVSERTTVTPYRYIDCLQTNKGSILQTGSEVCDNFLHDYTKRLGDILFKLLPTGSITGAPKPHTIQIVAETEGYGRGFYTGVMGCYAGGRLDSTVMIRFTEQENGQLYFRAGGGITAQSRWEDEYNEVRQRIYVPVY